MQAPFLEQFPLFEARTNGYFNYRVPTIVTSPRGVILATGEARRGRGGDWDHNDVFLRRSLDAGVTWEAARKVVDYQTHGERLISNFVLISDPQTEEIHALYCHSYARAFYMKSVDDGQKFTEPQDITAVFEAYRPEYNWKVIATGPGHGIQLENGRLIVPVWLSTGEGGGRHRPSIVSVIYSDDHGRTWRRGDVTVPTNDRFLNPSETMAVQLSDGRVMLNIRNESTPYRRLVSISANGVDGWSEPAFQDQLLEPQCMASLLKLDHTTLSPKPILFANPDNLERTMPGLWERAHDRKRLTVKCSLDDGNTWSIAKVLEAGPSGYSDLAEAADGTVLCFYECGMFDQVADTRYLTVARFNFAWLNDAAQPSA